MKLKDFASLSLYTGPSYLQKVIDDPDCSWIVGQWDGRNADTSKEALKEDIDCRIDFIINTFKQVIPKFKTDDRHFVIPEFFFRCAQGPYPYKKIDGKNYPFEYIVETLKDKLKACIPSDDANHYTLILGTALTSNITNYEIFLNSKRVLERQKRLNNILGKNVLQTFYKTYKPGTFKRIVDFDKTSSNDTLNSLNAFMQEMRGNPLCTVRNRGAYIHYDREIEGEVEAFVYEKQSESTIDLTMGKFDDGKITTGGMITEWLANYPSYSIFRKGDKQTTPSSTCARFSPSFYDYRDIGVEICLDHYYQRLRRTVDMSEMNGASTSHFPLVKQFITSGGMQIQDFAVAAHPESVIFNADGCHKVRGAEIEGDAGPFKGITKGVYCQAIQSKWTGREDNNTYYSHSQIAFTTADSKIGGFDNALGLNNVKASTYKESRDGPYNNMTDSLIPSATSIQIDQNLFAHNEAELHHYELP